MSLPQRDDRLRGVLLGVALGDALGLPFEGLSAARVQRRLRRLDRFQLAGRTGFVSDDTEQAALVAQALAGAGGDREQCRRLFRRSMVGWFARLPFGIGFGTLRACASMMLGSRHPGVRSAGNGAAMRAAIVGAHFADQPLERHEVGCVLASLTHTDSRAVEGALFVAEVAAHATRASSTAELQALLARSCSTLSSVELIDAVDRAIELAQSEVNVREAAHTLGSTGFVVHSVGLCSYLFARWGARPLDALEHAVRAGGDTDTHAAILGGWLGALHGEAGLPAALLSEIHDGPFGPTHLRALGDALASGSPPPRWSWRCALLRNLCLYPVVLAHGLARLAPW